MLNDQLSWAGIIKVVVVVVLLSAAVVGFLRYVDDPSASNYVAVFALGDRKSVV